MSISVYLKKEASKWLPFLFLTVVLSACAIVGAGPTGGKKDTAPPKVKAESPANKSTNFNARKISISFDENVDLGDVFKEVLISPTLIKMPLFTVNHKTVIIDFKGIKLDSNTTYSIQFGNAIKDLNEGNILKNYKYVFSTGAYLDSLSISGQSIDALSHNAVYGEKVELYKPGNDSDIFKKKPLYYARTDSQGRFHVNYLPKGEYKIYVLNDKSENYMVDENEDVGFRSQNVQLDSALSLKDTIKTFPYISPTLSIKKARLYNHALQVKFDKPVDSIFVFANARPFFTDYERANEARDSFIWWFGEDFSSMHIKAYAGRGKADSVVEAMVKSQPVKFAYFVNSTGDNSNIFGEPVVIKTSKPVDKVNLSLIELKADTEPLKSFGFKFLDAAHTLIAITAQYDETKIYKIRISPGAFTSIFNEVAKDTVTKDLSIPGQRQYGNLELTTEVGEGNYIFQLVGDNGQVVFYKNVSRETLVKIPFVNPGVYRLRLVKDENGNGRWDGGDLLRRRQPEPVYYYPKPVNIKANWELAGLKFDLVHPAVPEPTKR